MAAESFEEHGLVDGQDVDNAQEVEDVQETENALEAEEEADVELEIEEEDVELEIEQEDVELEIEQEDVELETEQGAETDGLQEADEADDLPETVGSQEKDVPEVDLNPSDEVPVDHNHLKVPEEKRWPGWPGENVFRMLVPVQMVGGIIGRKGEFIKKVCEETKARIKILDGPPGTTERAVMVSAKEEPDLDIPPALDGLLRIHKRTVDVDSEPADAQPGKSKTASTRLLVAATQAGSLIGKQGATIKTIQDGSNCTIRVLSGEHLPVCALPDDSVVEILGDPTGLHKAVELIAKHLRKFLVDRSVIGVFETQMQMPTARPNQNMPPPQSWRPPPQGFPASAGPGSGYGAPPQYMPPPRQYDNYYPPPRQDDNYYAPPDVPMDKMPRGGPAYMRDAPLGGLQQHPSIISKITQNMQIPLLYADAVIGTSGANISYIRRASGATIAIQETRGAPNEMTVEINGTSSQVQTAQQLIQNVMADAAAAAAQNSGTGPPGQAYNSYQHGPVYPSPPSNAGGHNSHGPPGDYNSVYGGSYGY